MRIDRPAELLPGELGARVTFPTLKKRSEFLAVRGGSRWSTLVATVEARRRSLPSRASMDTNPGRSGSGTSSDGNGADGPVAASGQAEFAGSSATDTAGSPARFGFTVTKKLGGAVIRNRIRRRLKAAVGEVAEGRCKTGFDYVIVAKPPALTCDFDELKRELAVAFDRVHQPRREKSRKPPG